MGLIESQVLIRKLWLRGIWHRRSRCDHGGMGGSDVVTRYAMLEATRGRKRRGRALSAASGCVCGGAGGSCQHLGFVPLMLILNCCPVDLWESKPLCLYKHQVVLICYRSHRELVPYKQLYTHKFGNLNKMTPSLEKTHTPSTRLVWNRSKLNL